MANSIMIVTASLGCGGLEKITINICNYYIKKGWKVRILCLMSYDKCIFYPILKEAEVVFFDINQKKKKIFNVFKWIKFIKQHINSFAPTHILAMTLKIGALCSLSSNKNIKLTMREISDPKSPSRSRLFDSILFLLCWRINSIIFQTNWEQQCYPYSMRKKGKVIPNPCNVDENLIRKKEKNVIVSVGRLCNEQKKHNTLIKSFKLLLEKCPDCVLKIYGDGPDLNDNLALAKKLGIDNKIEFCGNVPNVQQHIINADCFVMTSEFEGMSNALLEAYLLGVPCVTTDWPGVTDIISNNIDGIIVERNNEASIANGVMKVINDDSLSAFLSENAKKQRKRYDLENILLEYSKQIECR